MFCRTIIITLMNGVIALGHSLMLLIPTCTQNYAVSYLYKLQPVGQQLLIFGSRCRLRKKSGCMLKTEFTHVTHLLPVCTTEQKLEVECVA